MNEHMAHWHITLWSEGEILSFVSLATVQNYTQLLKKMWTIITVNVHHSFECVLHALVFKNYSSRGQYFPSIETENITNLLDAQTEAYRIPFIRIKMAALFRRMQ